MTRSTLHSGLAIIGLVLLFGLGLVACSEVTDTADDCTANQYFDVNSSFCRNCAPIVFPTCGEGCGFQLVADARGCQVAECDCNFCEEGSYFDTDLFSCVDCPIIESPACAEGCPATGTTLDLRGCEQRQCTCESDTCAAPEAPDCGDEGCCTVTQGQDAESCPTLVCSCPEEAPEGFYFEEEGRCLSCPDTNPPAACMN